MPSEGELLVLGTGVVGSALIEIVQSDRLATPLRLAGVANSRGVVLAPASPLRAEDLAELRARPRTSTPSRIEDDALDRLARTGRGVVVDATAEAGIGELYERALARGIHVVTANKKPLAGPWAARARLFEPGRRSGTAELRYEATVGAALPVIGTLKNLVRTGDRVDRIDCVLSGTLGFLGNAIAAGTPLSQAVAIARERGYTEPDPREDLGGADVARKAVILARELGARLETTDVALDPFVPADLLASTSPATLARELERLDANFSAGVERLRQRGEKLVYLARIDAGGGAGVTASAGPVALPLSHPAARLEGSSALVAFTTSRHGREPLVVYGAGAGGAVTASALVADVLAALGPGQAATRGREHASAS